MHYVCPDCNCLNNGNAWNKSTIDKYGSPIGLIENCEKDDIGTFFVCPNCKSVIDFCDIEVVKDKKEMVKDSLLKLAN